MTVPTDRASFKAYCLRALGAPVIEVNVDEEQVDDRVDEAMRYYVDYHYDATEKMFLKHVVTADDVTNGYITIPENIIGVINIFDIGSTISTNNLFNVKYQFMMNFIHDITTTQIAPYYTAMQYIALLEEVLIGKQPIRYTRHSNRLHIDTDWEKMPVGTYIVAECYEIIDPTDYADVWKDRWLLRYATALIKRQSGINTKKFEGMQLPGGVRFTGQSTYEEAVQEIASLEAEMLDTYMLPTSMMIG